MSLLGLSSVQSLSCVRLFATPWTIPRQAPLSMGSSRQEYWSESPCPPPWDLPDTEIEPVSLTSPALAGWFFTTSATWKARIPTLITEKIAHGVLSISLKQQELFHTK